MLRRALPSDVPAACNIVFGSLEAFGITPAPGGRDSDIFAFGSRPSHDDWVFELPRDKGERPLVVGMIALGPHEGGGWISKLFVSARARRLGVGRALLERAVESARERGYTRVGLRTRAIFVDAVRLYERSGFIRMPMRGDYADADTDDRVYELVLRRR